LNGRPFGCKPNALTAELSALTQFIVQEAARSVNARRIFSVLAGERVFHDARTVESKRNISGAMPWICVPATDDFLRDFAGFLALYWRSQ
jgi:hypothetical protein